MNGINESNPTKVEKEAYREGIAPKSTQFPTIFLLNYLGNGPSGV